MRRVIAAVFFVLLGFSALTGCHDPFTGSLVPREGTGTGPIAPTGQAQVTSLSPSTVVAGSAAFTLTVTGMNFLPTTSVLWDDNTSLPTTYISSTVLKAQVPAERIAKPGNTTITPSPVLTFNFGATLTIAVPPLTGNNSFTVSKVGVQANDMVWDQANQQFYLSVASGNGIDTNTITALNPKTGVLGPSVSTGSEAVKLAVSADDAYLYAGLDSAGSVRRYTLPAVQSDIDIPLGAGSYGPYYAIDVEVEPGSSHTVAVSRGSKLPSPGEVGGIAIYDDAVARPQSVPGFGFGPGSIDSLLWNPNGHSLYGIDTEGGAGFYIMSISSMGVQIQTQPLAAGALGKYLHFDAITGYLYSDTGKVLDPGTGSVIGSFPLDLVQGGLSAGLIMVPDGANHIAYFLGQTVYSGGAGNYVVEAFDLTHFTFLGAIPITNVSGFPSKLVRWGDNGLAFLTGTGRGVVGDGVYLISGAFVTSPAP